MRVVRSRRALAAALLALALPFTLVACGDEEGDGGDTQSQETPETEETTPAEDTAEAQLVHVVSTEYQFEGLPATTAAGSYQFHLQNDGKEPHELALFKLLTDTPIDELIKLPQKEAEEQIQPVGFTFAKPGDASKKPLEAELDAGNYAAVCFVPVKGEGPPHAFKGMVHEMTVE